MKDVSIEITPLGLLEVIRVDLKTLSLSPMPDDRKQLATLLDRRIKQLSAILQSK